MKQTNKKILFATRLYYPHIGGVEKHVNKITRELLLKKKLVTIVTELHDTQLERKEQFQNHVIHRIPIGNNDFVKKFYIWYWFIKNISLIKDADIIHMHDVAYWLLPFKLLFPHKKFYVTFHGYEDYPVKKKWIVQRKIAEKLSNGTICIGLFMKKWYKANPSIVLYGGADLPVKGNNEQKEFSALYFGRLEKQTNAYEYAVAAKEISKVSTFKALFIGEGPLKNKIKKIVDVKPFDPLVEKKIPGYRYIFVSRYLSMFEALAHKRLVFAFYDTPIKKDYLFKSPFIKFIVPVRDTAQLQEKVLYFKKHPKEEKRLVNAGYEWVKNNTWKDAVSEYLKLWNHKAQ